MSYISAPKVSAESTNPEDVAQWENYYAACEADVDASKPGMRDRF